MTCEYDMAESSSPSDAQDDLEKTPAMKLLNLLKYWLKVLEPGSIIGI